jgi:hypothetical protein
MIIIKNKSGKSKVEKKLKTKKEGRLARRPSEINSSAMSGTWELKHWHHADASIT